MNKALLLVLAACVCVCSATLDQVFVSPFGEDASNCGAYANNPCLTLSYALTLVTVGGTINVMSGFYYGQVNFPTISSSVNLVAYGSSPAVFDAQNMGSLTSITIKDSRTGSSPSVQFSGLTFQNWGNSYTGFVSSLCSVDTPIISFFNCTFKNNGIALLMGNNAQVSIYSSTLTGTRSQTGFSFYQDNTVYNSNLTVNIEILTASNLEAPIYAVHPGLILTMSNALIQFSTNGLQIANYKSLNVDDCRIDQCSNGVVFSSLNNVGKSSFTQTTFTSNGGSSNQGGAMQINYNNVVRLTQCTFANNTSPYQGGAVACANGATLSALDCSFERNKAPDAAAVWCGSTCAFNGQGNVLLNNVQNQDSGPCNGL